MICYKCRKQIPDDSMSCPNCGQEIAHHEQLPKEILLRRYQRWFFYGVITLLFLGMIGVILKIYSTNTELLLRMANVNQALEEKEAVLTETSANLEQTRQTLASSRDQLSKVEFDLSTKLTELNQKTEEYKEVLNEKEEILARLNAESGERSEIMRRYEQCSVKISDIDANVYAMIVRLGVGISNNDLKKIPLADANLGGDDADGDGLSDMIEHALGRDPNKKDTDNDGYNDKEEILNGFNPLGPGMMPIDKAFADRQKGKMLLQVENKGEAWYVNPDDGKRYFLGKPADAIRVFAGFGQ
jgi:predicted nucleic acid-binding Zn ribbon protein